MDTQNQQAECSPSGVTVIPVDFPNPKIRSFSQQPPPPEYLVEQYSDYVRERTREEYMRGDYNINNTDVMQSEGGSLYSVSQRFEQDKLTHDGSSSQGSASGTQSTSDSHTNSRGLKVCVYLKSGALVHMHLSDGGEATVQDMTQALLHEEEVGLPRSAATAFTLWISSPLLELQLRLHQRPAWLRRKWPALLRQFASASESRLLADEPVISFQRNVFFPKREEEHIKEQKALELLYEEARSNVVEGRYPCEVPHYAMLAGIQACIQLGPFDPHLHTPQFFRSRLDEFLPRHARSVAWWAWLGVSGKDSMEARIVEQYKRIPAGTTARRLVRKYLEFCWPLPFYGAAFFHGQVEQPVRGLTSLMTHQDVPVLVAVNATGVHVIDPAQGTVLLGFKYQQLSWEFAKPAQEENTDCLPCLFLQFLVVENGARVSKILQIFSKQAALMDALISVFVEDLKRKPAASSVDEPDRPPYDTATDSDDTHVPLTSATRREAAHSRLANKLSKLTLATFDEEGRCVGQMGSWSFGY